MNNKEILNDIKYLISNWIMVLDDDGTDPWRMVECINIMNKYNYTKDDYNKFLKTIY